MHALTKRCLSVAPILLLALGACTTKSHRTSEYHPATPANSAAGSTSGSTTAVTTPASVKAAAAEDASHVIDVSFSRDSAVLSEQARQSLVDMIDSAQKKGTIEEIKILAWADSDYPSVRAKRLSKNERELADDRADSVRGFIKSMFSVGDIDSYNMAERPNAIERLFRTDDLRVKRAMENAGIPNSDSLNKARMTKASHAVVMIITK